jgi:hypothetical protein
MTAPRPPIDPERLHRARQIVDLAWADLPLRQRTLLESIGAAQYDVVDRALGSLAADCLFSAGHGDLATAAREDLDQALGAWIPPLQIVLIDAGHHQHKGLDDQTYEAALARIAWHEWGHALSVTRASGEEVAAGRRYLELAPPEIADFIRRAGYAAREYTYELVAELYALLMARRRRGDTTKPRWLHDQLYDLVRRLTGWTR